MIIIIIMIKSMAEADFMLCITYCKQSGNLEGNRLTNYCVAGSINTAFALFLKTLENRCYLYRDRDIKNQKVGLLRSCLSVSI